MVPHRRSCGWPSQRQSNFRQRAAETQRHALPASQGGHRFRHGGARPELLQLLRGLDKQAVVVAQAQLAREREEKPEWAGLRDGGPRWGFARARVHAERPLRDVGAYAAEEDSPTGVAGVRDRPRAVELLATYYLLRRSQAPCG